jgi:hypothetical protein
VCYRANSEQDRSLTVSCGLEIIVGECQDSPKERDHPEDHGVGGKMGSKWILGRLAWGV